ncbi:methyltransferase [Actinophytocola gossypii]|uniref:O-methyltransferase n=1 Tax=Actinophytocola gossypii TaxID=2812003 RepID=A0ABT2JD70_9PSEU|nr:methyltransferase [Actinophytocola gossypii]MCT2585817.1 hypothetical protein [Actinophytocola gossypii]
MSTESTDTTVKDVQVLLDLMFPTSGQCLGIAAELGVADLLADGPLGIAELAEKTSAHQHALQSTLQILAEDGIFAEVEPGVFANTSRSELLRAGVPNSQHVMSQFAASEWLWRSYAKLGHSVKTGQAAFDEAYGMNLWAFLGRNQDKGREFNAAMNEFSATLGPRIVADYPKFGEAGVVADLGGGTGTYLATILEQYPSVSRGVLADLPPVIEQAKARPDLAGLIEGGRLEFHAGDFFETVPAGVDLYVCKQITHSWNDEKLLSVLKRCRDASPTARIAATELVLRPGVQKFVKYFDVMMLVTMAGFLRTEEQYAEVFRQAGYRLERVVPTQTAFSIIEAVPVD